MAHTLNISPAAVADPPNSDPPGVEQRRALIERVAASDQFSRSARLRDFLLYVGRQSLKEGCPEIHEEEIGVRVFGRPASYDRGQDNIVRVNATELRKRVDAWFAGPGAAEQLIFEIPRGAYKPVFRWRTQAAPIPIPEPVAPTPAPLPEEAPAPVSTETPAARNPLAWERSAWERRAWITLTIALAALAGFLFYQNRTLRTALLPWQNQPAVSAFWKGFLDPHRQTDLVMPDDSLSVMEDIADYPIQLDDYLNRNFMGRIQSSSFSADRKQDLAQVYNHNLVTFGAVRAAQSVLAQVPPTYPHYLTLARNFSADELNRSNVVLIGGAKAMPWAHLLDDMMNFSTDFDYKNNVAFVRNRNPKPGEPALYNLSSAPNSTTCYAVIAYLPNPSRTGHILLLAGTDSDATGSAAAFLASEPQMEKLRAALHVQAFPYFEVLLKTSRLSGTFFDAEPIAWRTYPDLH
jgi:hypothetical protein